MVVSSSTSMLAVLAWPSRSTATKVRVSPPRPPSPAPVVSRLQRVKSTTPVYGATFQVKTPVPGAPPQVTVTEATPFSETASTATGAFSEMVCPARGARTVSSGPAPPSAGTLGRPRSRQPPRRAGSRHGTTSRDRRVATVTDTPCADRVSPSLPAGPRCG